MTEEHHEPQPKFLKMTFHSDGKIDLESNAITVFDLWAVSNYLKMRGDEMYVQMQTQAKMAEAAAQNPGMHLAGPNQLSRQQRKTMRV